MSKSLRQSITLSEHNDNLLKKYMEQRGLTANSAISTFVSEGLNSWLKETAHGNTDSDIGVIESFTQHRIISLLISACLEINSKFKPKDATETMDLLLTHVIPDKLTSYDRMIVTKILIKNLRKMASLSFSFSETDNRKKLEQAYNYDIRELAFVNYSVYPIADFVDEENYEYQDFTTFLLNRFLNHYQSIISDDYEHVISTFLQDNPNGKIFISGLTGSGKSIVMFDLACQFGLGITDELRNFDHRTYYPQLYTVHIMPLDSKPLSDLLHTRLNQMANMSGFVKLDTGSKKEQRDTKIYPALILNVYVDRKGDKSERSFSRAETTWVNLPNF